MENKGLLFQPSIEIIPQRLYINPTIQQYTITYRVFKYIIALLHIKHARCVTAKKSPIFSFFSEFKVQEELKQN